MSNVRLNTKNINKKVLTVIIAAVLLISAGAVALGLSLTTQRSENAEASISYTPGSLTKKVSPYTGGKQMIFMTIDSNITYDVKAAWAYYNMPVSGKLYQIPLTVDGTAWYASYTIDSSFEQGQWTFAGISIETTDGQDLFESYTLSTENADFVVTDATEELEVPQYQLASASVGATEIAAGSSLSFGTVFEGDIPVDGAVHAYFLSPSGKSTKQAEMSKVGSDSETSTWYGTMNITTDMEPGLWKFVAVQGGQSDGTMWTYNLALEDSAVKTVNVTGTSGSSSLPTYSTDDGKAAKPALETIALQDQTVTLSLNKDADGNDADEVNLYYVKSPFGGVQYQVKMTYDEAKGEWTGTIPASELEEKGWWYLGGIQIKSGDKESYYYDKDKDHADLEDDTKTTTDLTSGDFYVGSLFEVEDITEEMDYDGYNHRPLAVVHPKGKTSVNLVEGVDYTVVYQDAEGNVVSSENYDSAFVNAGTYTMTVEAVESSGYQGNKVVKTWEIKKIPVNVKKAPNGLTMTYNSTEQALVSVPVVEGAEEVEGTQQVFYAVANEAPEVDSDVWSTDIPKKFDADVYSVYYWIKGDKNHLDYEVTKTVKDATINKYSIKVIPQAKEKIYDGTTVADVYIDDKIGAGDEFLKFENVKGEYTDRNVSDNTKVNITNKDEIVITVEGGQGKVENYDIAYNLDEAYAAITPRSISMAVPQDCIHSSKVYDGTNKAEIDLFYVETGFGGDRLVVTGLTAEYSSKDVDKDIPIIVPNIESAKIEGVEGTRTDNYQITELTADELKGEITQKRAFIAARDYEIEYGDPVPKYETKDFADFVVGEEPVEGVDYELQCSATSLSAPGYYVINVVAKDTDLMKNYNLINQRGCLTILQGDTYTVRFDSNGADEGVMDDQVIDCDALVSLNKNVFTREGYTFLGWSTDRKAKAPSISDEGTVKNLTDRAGRITLYAVWRDNSEELPDEANCYTIKFDANGGDDGGMVSQLVEKDKRTKLAKNIFTRKDYKFIGWSDNKEATSKSLNDEAYVYNIAEPGETITLYAVWGETEGEVDPDEGYTIHFDSNGGSGTMSDQVIELNQSTSLSKNLFKKDGYRFLGWSTIKDATSAQLADQYIVTQFGKSGEIITLYAVWQDESETPIDPAVDGYTVRYEANGGVGLMADQVIAVDKSTKLSKSIFKRSGYTFLGWSKNADSTAVSIADEQEVTNLAKAGGVITLYAVWWDDSSEMPDDSECYTIHYDANGGTGTMADQKVVADSTAKLATNMYTREGYTFLGWSAYSDVDVASLKDEEEVTELTEKGKTITLYAIWKEGAEERIDPLTQGYTIHFDANGGQGTMSDQVIAVNKTANLAKNIYLRTDYRFLGWALTKDATVPSYDDNQKVVNVTRLGQTITLYAVWQSTSEKPIDESNAYSVRFDSNGGDGVMRIQKIEVGKTANLALCTFLAPEGFEFLGWSPDSDASDASLLDGAEVKDLAKQGKRITLFAVWKRTSEAPTPTQVFTVKYDANGGVGTMKDQKITVNEPTKLSATVMTREGYSFLGWSQDKNATMPSYKDCETVSNMTAGGQSVTLYAIWESIYSKTVKAPVLKAGLVYDGTQQDLLTRGDAFGGTLLYGVSSTEDASGVTEWSEAVPQATNAGTYNIFYYVKADENHVDSEVSELQSVEIEKRKTEVTVYKNAEEKATAEGTQQNRAKVNQKSESAGGSNEQAEETKPVAQLTNLVNSDKLKQGVDYNIETQSANSTAEYEVAAQETDAMSNYELVAANDSVVVKNVSNEPAGNSSATDNGAGASSESTSIVGVTFVSVLMIAAAVAFIVARKNKKNELGQ